MDFIFDLIGRFHPLIVHLPIGFLLLGLMMLVFDRKDNKHQKIIRFAFLWGTFSTLAAIITGSVQYNREGYPWEDIQGHLILGLLTFVISFLMYLKLNNYGFFQKISYKFLGYCLVVILSITGHLGGNLTHGKDHLTEPLPDTIKEALGMDVPSRNLILLPDSHQKLPLYSGVIQPILDQKCVSCHNPKKTKGGLLMNNYKGLMEGGEGGPIILAPSVLESEILKRIHLPREEKKHMPPKAKTQLTKAEIKIIEKWVNFGAPEKKTVSELGLSPQLFTSFFPKDETGIYPDLKLKPLNISLMDSIKSTGLHVAPIYKTSPLLKISAINNHDFDDQNASILFNVSDYVVDLDLGQTQVTDSVFEILKKLKYLTVLKLNHTAITGNGINQLKDLKYLKQINLVYSGFESDKLEKMYSFPALEQVFLFGTPTSYSTFKVPDQFQTIFQMGNYKLDEEIHQTL